MATAVACGPASAPELDGLTDQVAQVGTELRIELNGTSTAGGRLSYSFKAPDVQDLTGHAEITVAPSGAGVFRWTPLVDDVGSHAFDFTVSNGGASTTVTINIDVKSAIGSSSAPVFRQPLGTGTTVDLSKSSCIDVDVVVDDQAAPSVTIAQEQPAITGGQLMQKDGQTATWHWCPTAAQQNQSRYTLVLSADDGQNPKTIKDYLLVLRGTGAPSCGGAGPAIAHTASDQTTRLDLPIAASISDSIGLKDSPLFYYSMTDPGANPDLSSMIQLSPTLSSGDNTSGSWTATVPNPVASATDGTTSTIYYVFVADDYDATNSCGHTTQSQVYQMTVTAGGSSTAGLCQPCSDDAQCGAGNECVYMGSMGDSYCVQSCDSGCPTGYTCSNDALWSVDGAMATQCVPQSGSCAMPTGLCQDDSWTPNQTQMEASNNPVMDPDYYDLVSCPDPNSTYLAEDDWYMIDPSTQSTLDLYLDGDGATDLDLHIYDSTGTELDYSISDTAHEELHECLPAATYYVKVNGYGYARSEYTLDYYATDAGSCP